MAKSTRKARHSKPEAKAKPSRVSAPVVRAKQPAVPRAVVRLTPAHATTPAAAPAEGGSGSSLSNRSVLLLTMLLAIAAGVLILATRAGWRRFKWWRRYHRYMSAGKSSGKGDTILQAPPVQAVVQPWPGDAKANGSNGAVANHEVTVAKRAGADGS
jgi:hypothetical protein